MIMSEQTEFFLLPTEREHILEILKIQVDEIILP